MADIIIRGGKMPSMCAECDSIRRVSKHDYVCNITGDSIDGEGFALYKRQHWCPLSEVPPHGRLIDADALSRDFPIRRDRYDREHGDEHFINGIETVIEYVEYMPTILEANEAE